MINMPTVICTCPHQLLYSILSTFAVINDESANRARNWYELSQEPLHTHALHYFEKSIKNFLFNVGQILRGSPWSLGLFTTSQLATLMNFLSLLEMSW